MATPSSGVRPNRRLTGVDGVLPHEALQRSLTRSGLQVGAFHRELFELR